MIDQPDIQKHVNAEVARLVMELATAKAIIEVLERAQTARTEPEPSVPGAGQPGEARGAHEPAQE